MKDIHATFVTIDHVQIAMPRGGEALARAFYGNVLGLREVPKPEVLAVRGGAWFRSGTVELHLGVEEDFRPAKKAHPALVVTDLEAVKQRLRRKGCEVKDGEELEGRVRLYVDDPFGNRLEVVQRAMPPTVVREIRTERMLLRSLRESDREEWKRVFSESEPQFRPWFPALPGTRDDAFDLEMHKVANPEAYLRWTGQSEDGRLIGFFHLGEIVRGVFQNAYISWSVSAEHWGQGYATEGAWAMLDLAFSTGSGLGLHRVQANMIPVNERSVRVAERLGMRHEGKAERYLKIAGAWQDHLMYAKTSDEHVGRYLK